MREVDSLLSVKIKKPYSTPSKFSEQDNAYESRVADIDSDRVRSIKETSTNLKIELDEKLRKVNRDQEA